MKRSCFAGFLVLVTQVCSGQPPRIQIRSILLSCPFRGPYNTYKNEEVAVSRGKEILDFYGFGVDEPLLHSEVVRCKRKLVITLKLTNFGKYKPESEYVVVDHAFDPTTKEKIRLLNPIVLKVIQQSVMQAYPLTVVHIVNAEATEEVIHKGTGPGFKGCSTALLNATCGHAYFEGKIIPYSEGFCCSCDAIENMKRQPTGFINTLPDFDMAFSLRSGLMPQPLKLRINQTNRTFRWQDERSSLRRKKSYPVFHPNYYKYPPMEPAKGFLRSDIKAKSHGDPWAAARPLSLYLKEMPETSSFSPRYHLLSKKDRDAMDLNHVKKTEGITKNITDTTIEEGNLNHPKPEEYLYKVENSRPWTLLDLLRKKRQVTSSGTQVRGGQDCIDRSFPHEVDPVTYHESAHCLRFSDLWYTVYSLKSPFLSHMVDFHIFEKHCIEPTGEQWTFITERLSGEIGTFRGRTMNEDVSLVMSYTPMDVANREFICLAPEQILLLVPRPLPREKLHDLPQPSERSGRFLVIKPKDIGIDGDECDKTGVSYSAFAKQPKRCDVPAGTCLTRQPLHMWKHDVALQARGEKGKFFLENYANVPKRAVRNFQNKEFLELHYEGKYASVVEIEYKADSNAILRKESTVQISEIYVDSTCEQQTRITVTATNTGLVSSLFRPRLTNCPVTIPSVWTEQAGPLVVIAPQRTHIFRLSLFGRLPSARFHCSIEMLNSEGKIVAVRRVLVERYDRCLCMWHCLCACSGSLEAMKCHPMTIEHYHAAGFFGSMAVETKDYPSEESKYDILMFVGKILTLLLVMHVFLIFFETFVLEEDFSCYEDFFVDYKLTWVSGERVSRFGRAKEGLCKAIIGLCCSRKISQGYLILVCPELLDDLESEKYVHGTRRCLFRFLEFMYNIICFFVIPGWIALFISMELLICTIRILKHIFKFVKKRDGKPEHKHKKSSSYTGDSKDSRDRLSSPIKQPKKSSSFTGDSEDSRDRQSSSNKQHKKSSSITGDSKDRQSSSNKQYKKSSITGDSKDRQSSSNKQYKKSSLTGDSKDPRDIQSSSNKQHKKLRNSRVFRYKF